MLKYTSKLVIKREEEGGNMKPNHKFKWNHSKYKCQCNGKEKEHKKECCRYPKKAADLKP